MFIYIRMPHILALSLSSQHNHVPANWYVERNCALLENVEINLTHVAKNTEKLTPRSQLSAQVEVVSDFLTAADFKRSMNTHLLRYRD